MAEANPEPGPSGESQQLTFEEGQIIFYEDPYGAVLASNRINKACSYCFKMIKANEVIKPCPSCKKLVYCSTQCLVTDIPFHTGECDVLAASSVTPSEIYRLGLRLLSRSLADKRRGEQSRSRFFGSMRTIDSIKDRIHEANEDTVSILRAKAQSMKTKYDRAHNTDVSEDEILKILFKIRTNGKNVYDSSGVYVNRLGIALYLGYAKFRHTCVPVTKYAWSFNGANVALTALETFSVNSPSDLKIHYVSPNLPRIQRRSELSTCFYFSCECPRCEEEKGKEEQNMPTGLEEHLNRSAIEDGWKEQSREFYEVAQHWHPQNYYRYNLAYKLQFLCAVAGDYLNAVRYGFGALPGSIVFEEKKQIVYMLCRDMERLQYNRPDHSQYALFERTRQDAILMLTTVFEKNCILVKGLRHMAYRSERQAALPDDADEEQ